MMGKLVTRIGVRNLLVLGLIATMGLRGGTMAFARDSDDPAAFRREDLVTADLVAQDDDDDDVTGGVDDPKVGMNDATADTGDASRATHHNTGATARDDTKHDGGAARPLDTGDTRSNDGTIGGGTTAARLDTGDTLSNDGTIGGGTTAPRLDTGDTLSNDGTIGGGTTAATAEPEPTGDDSGDDGSRSASGSGDD